MRTNPFAGCGKIVSGENFIGRKEHLQRLEDSISGERYSSVAIIGLPRMGKSSLARQSVEIIKNKDPKNTFIIWLNVAKLNAISISALGFFQTMVDACHDEMSMSTENNQQYSKICEMVLSPLKKESDERQIRLQILKYFEFIKKFLNYKIIFVLDEFDGVKGYFELADFQLLRELAYDPKYGICLITTSRKTLYDIEAKNGAISNFANIFVNIRLGVFSENDEKEYWSHFKNKWDVDEEYKKDVYYFTGRHPYLMDKINFDMYCKEIKNAKEYGQNLELMDALDDITSILEKENLLNAAIQLVVGPFYDVNQKQIEQLERYQFIRRVSLNEKKAIFENSIGPKWDNYAYACFSDFCTHDFFRRYIANVPYFKIWSETENSLRDVVKKHIDVDNIDDWKNKMKHFFKDSPPYPTWKIDNWESNIKQLKDNQSIMINKFPQLKNNHFIYFTLTSQIFDIFIQPEQKWYNEHVFTGNWQKWTEKFKHLKELRNPVAHNNDLDKLNKEVEKAKHYCQDIKKAIAEASF